jgi:type IV pilus assembly protein PilB
MSFYSLQTSERAVSAIINAGKIDPVVLNNERYQNLDWSQKLNTLIKDRLVDELQLTTLFAKAVSLPRIFPEEEAVDEAAVILLPIQFTLEHSLLAYAIEDGFLKVLIIDPRSTLLKDELKTHAKIDILFELTSLTHLDKLLSTHRVTSAQDKLRGGVAVSGSSFGDSPKPIATAKEP